MLRLLFAALVGLSCALTGLLGVRAEGTPEASPAASKMPAYLAGNAYDLVPKGKPGKLDVVVVGPLFRSEMPIIIRNNTKDRMANVEASAVARDESGTLLAAGNTQNVYPDLLPPGSISLAYIYFENADNLNGAKFEVKAKGDKADLPSDYIPLKITEVSLQTNHLIGIAHNEFTDTIEAPSVYGQCFDSSGEITGYFDGYIEGDLAVDEEAPFDVPLYGTDSCDLFLVIAAGYSFNF
jgi:hypothetical protein